jgi:cobalt-zinc-cadmium efflux system membrane fusion protein
MRRHAAFLILMLAAGCGRSPEAQPESSSEPDPLSVTQWTAKTELFAEYAPLAVGHTSRFAIHLTRLDTFKALTAGRVEVRLTGGGVPEEVFIANAPSRPGTFGVDVKPARAGSRELTIALQLAGLDDEHRVGAVRVHADQAAASKAAAESEAGPEGISFLKEQQWVLDFATAVIREAPVRESLRVPATIAARPNGAADAVSPIDGRLVRVLDVPVGRLITEGQELARIQPSSGAPSDLPRLEQARAEAASAFDLATRDRARAERLVEAGAAPQKRLEEARASEAQAQARLNGASKQLTQFQATRSGSENPGGDGLFIVRAPVDGSLVERTATTGANVIAGSVLFRMVDARQVNVRGQVPEADLAKARLVEAAEIELPGRAERLRTGGFLSLGRVLDPQSRTIPIEFALDNRGPSLAVGQTVSLHLLMGEAPARPVVPASAVVDDAGRPIVFVQREGETFDRRPVTLGARAGDLVQVVEGVSVGERVVTKGAYLVRLASLSTQAPSHGHVH